MNKPRPLNPGCHCWRAQQWRRCVALARFRGANRDCRERPPWRSECAEFTSATERHGGRSLLAALLLLVACAGCRGKNAADNKTADDEAATPIVQVEVQPLVRTSLDETIEVLGTSQPLRSRTARVTTAVDGRVAAILPADGADLPLPKGEGTALSGQTLEGQLVTERQVIVRLDDSLAQAAVAKAEGALAEVESTAAAQNVPRPQQLIAAEAARDSAALALQAAEAQLKRLSDIEQLVGAAQVADAQTAVERAKADKRAAEARLAELSEVPASRKTAEIEAKLKAAAADLRAAKTQLELCNVRSPIPGRLGRLNVFLGQSLPLGTPVATVTDLAWIEVEATVPAKRIDQVHVGQVASIEWGNPPSTQKLDGKVTFVAQELEPGSGGFPLRIAAENPDERLRAGLPVQVRVVLRRVDSVLAAPRAAVIEEAEAPYLVVAEAKGDKRIAHRVTVKLGVRTADWIEVAGEGLTADTQVVTNGNYYLPDEAVLEIGKQGK